MTHDPEQPRNGLHHVTAYASNPAKNVAFYQQVLGLKLIKQTINYDDPSLYHLYYGDRIGSPGTALTFFSLPGAKSGVRGAGEASETRFSVPLESIPFWQNRFSALNIRHGQTEMRFGETCLPFQDHDGMSLALVAQERAGLIKGEPREGVPADCAIRGFSGVTLHSAKPKSTAAVLKALGYRESASEGEITRWTTGSAGLATHIDLQNNSGSTFHKSGAGSVHHIAIAAENDAAQVEMVEALQSLGLSVTEQKNRTYFRSVYCREPGGILIEIATLEPGFAVDEPEGHLGEKLMLPSWLEPRRSEIEAALPPLTL
jgi:glyoxalase family protein